MCADSAPELAAPCFTADGGVAIYWHCIGGGTVEFRMRMPADDPASWIAVGFSDDQSMPDSDIVLGWAPGATADAVVADLWAGSGYTMPVLDETRGGRGDADAVAARVADGSLELTFRRRVATNDTWDNRLDQPNYLLFAYGGKVVDPADPQSAFTQHRRMGFSAGKVTGSACTRPHCRPAH